MSGDPKQGNGSQKDKTDEMRKIDPRGHFVKPNFPHFRPFSVSLVNHAIGDPMKDHEGRSEKAVHQEASKKRGPQAGKKPAFAKERQKASRLGGGHPARKQTERQNEQHP